MQRSGVCQDIAHLVLAGFRTVGIPGRYVSGYLHPRREPEIGVEVAGESHAWIEFYDGAWTAWDPTNDIPVGDRHVVVARARDYSDVSPLQGVYSGPKVDGRGAGACDAGGLSGGPHRRVSSPASARSSTAARGPRRVRNAAGRSRPTGDEPRHVDDAGQVDLHPHVGVLHPDDGVVAPARVGSAREALGPRPVVTGPLRPHVEDGRAVQHRRPAVRPLPRQVVRQPAGPQLQRDGFRRELVAQRFPGAPRCTERCSTTPGSRRAGIEGTDPPSRSPASAASMRVCRHDRLPGALLRGRKVWASASRGTSVARALATSAGRGTRHSGGSDPGPLREQDRKSLQLNTCDVSTPVTSRRWTRDETAHGAPRDGMVRVSVRVRDLRVSTKLFARFRGGDGAAGHHQRVGCTASQRGADQDGLPLLLGDRLRGRHRQGPDRVPPGPQGPQRHRGRRRPLLDADAHRPDDAGPDRVGLAWQTYLASDPPAAPPTRRSTPRAWRSGAARSRRCCRWLRTPTSRRSSHSGRDDDRGRQGHQRRPGRHERRGGGVREADAADGRTAYRQAVGSSSAAPLLAVLLAAAVSVVIARSIARPLDRVVTVVEGSPSVAWTSGWTTTVATRWVAWRRRRTRPWSPCPS